jgi:hypothetical protein
MHSACPTATSTPNFFYLVTVVANVRKISERAVISTDNFDSDDEPHKNFPGNNSQIPH